VALTWVRTHDWDVSAWRGRSACRDSDPDIFFPIGSSGPAVEQIETARRICAACPVGDQCLEFALETNQEAGIWGGTTEDERRRLRKSWLSGQRITLSS
jgi:WhiB family redox-sensing transcriptional regulator